jgi:hypothetical protein
MVLTCVSILSVDFHIFPREFVKTEEFGVSLVTLFAQVNANSISMKFNRWMLGLACLSLAAG